MKVGLVIDDHMARPGGVQEYVRGLARYLIGQGHEVVIFSSAGRTTPDDVRVVAIGSPLPFRGSGSSTSIPLTLATPAQLRRLLRREGCDVLHVMAPYSPTLAGRLLVQSDAVHVMTFHVAAEPGVRRWMLGRLARLQWRSLRRCGGRIAVSRTAAATGRALYGGQYEVIPNGVDLAQFITEGTRPAGRDDDGVVRVLYVGRLEQRKGVRYLVEAWARLEKQYARLELVIAGDGPERGALERLAGELGLRRVQFRGYVPASELANLLATADIFCAPATEKESFGIVLIEAFAAGLPVVAAANEGYAALLADHPGNVLVRPGDARALAGAIATLAELPLYRREVGQRNRAAATRYDWQVVGREVVGFYRRLLEARVEAAAGRPVARAARAGRALSVGLEEASSKLAGKEYAVPRREWLPEEHEETVCCRCGIKGRLLFTERRFGIVQCPRCGLVFTSPRLTKEAIRAIYESSSYFDEGVYGFAKQVNFGMLLQRAWTRGRLDLIQRLVPGDLRGRHLLEVGCAYGLFLEAARARGCEVSGVEYSSTAVQWSREHLRLPVQQGELKDATLPEHSFDVICFWDVVEHVDDPVAFLRLVSRYVAPGGSVVFSTPYFNSLPARLLRSRWWTLRPEQHLWHYTPRTLGLLFADAGLRLERVITNPLAAANIGRLDSLVGIAHGAA